MDSVTIHWSGECCREVAKEVASELTIDTRIFDVSRVEDATEKKSGTVWIPENTIFFAPEFSGEQSSTGELYNGMFMFLKPSSALLYGYMVTKYYPMTRMDSLNRYTTRNTFAVRVPKEKLPEIGHISKSKTETERADYDRKHIEKLVIDERAALYQPGGTKKMDVEHYEPVFAKITLSRKITVLRASTTRTMLELDANFPLSAAVVDLHAPIASELARIAKDHSETAPSAYDVLSDEALILARRNSVAITRHSTDDYRGRTEWQILKAFVGEQSHLPATISEKHVAMMYLMTFSNRQRVDVFTIHDAYKTPKFRRVESGGSSSTKKKEKQRARMETEKEVHEKMAIQKERRTLAMVAMYTKDDQTNTMVVLCSGHLPRKSRRPEAAETIRLLSMHIVQAVCPASMRLVFPMPIKMTPDDYILVDLRTREKAWRTRSELHELIVEDRLKDGEIALIKDRKHLTIRRSSLKLSVYTPLANGAPKVGLFEVYTPVATAIVSNKSGALEQLLNARPQFAVMPFVSAPRRYSTPVHIAVAYDRLGILRDILEPRIAQVQAAKGGIEEVRRDLYTPEIVDIAMQRKSKEVLEYFRSLGLEAYTKARAANPSDAKRLALEGNAAEFAGVIDDMLKSGIVISFRVATRMLISMTAGSQALKRYDDVVRIFAVLHERGLLPACPVSLYTAVTDMTVDASIMSASERKQYEALSHDEDAAKAYLHASQKKLEAAIRVEKGKALKYLEKMMNVKSLDIANALFANMSDDNAKWVAHELVLNMIDTHIGEGSHARIVGFMWQFWHDDRNSMIEENLKRAEQARHVAEKLLEFNAAAFFEDPKLNKRLPISYIIWAIEQAGKFDGRHNYDTMLLNQTMTRYGVPSDSLSGKAMKVAKIQGKTDDDDDDDDDDSSYGSSSGEEEEEEEEEEYGYDKVVNIKDVFDGIRTAWRSLEKSEELDEPLVSTIVNWVQLLELRSKSIAQPGRSKRPVDNDVEEWIKRMPESGLTGLTMPDILAFVAMVAYKTGIERYKETKKSRKRRRDGDPVSSPAASTSSSSSATIRCAMCGNSAKNRCSRCHTVAYCGEACQKAHWAVHRVSCNI